MKIKQIISLFGACFMLVACDQNPNQPDSALKASASNFPSQAEFDNEITQIPGTDHFVYRGSEPLNGQVQVDAYYAALRDLFAGSESELARKTYSLIVSNVSDMDLTVPYTNRNAITYCVDNSFGSNKTKIVNALNAAATVWNNAGGGAITFTHVVAQDGAGCTSTNANTFFNVTSTVIPTSNGFQTYASSFFPDEQRQDRFVVLNTSLISSSQAFWTGTLIHEFGHILGFRHEFVNPTASCAAYAAERTGANTSTTYGVTYSSQYRTLSDYDVASVMNYSDCGGTQNASITGLSAGDRAALVKVYGSLFVYTSNTMIQVGTPFKSGYNFGTPTSGAFVTVSGDFDGDGNTDFIRVSNTMIFAYYASPENGRGTFKEVDIPLGVDLGTQHAAQWPLLVGDFNGDGRMDFVRYSNTLGVYAFISTGQSFTMMPKVAYPTGYNFTGFKPVVGDFAMWSSIGNHIDHNSDGFDDVAFFSNSCKFYFLGHPSGVLTLAFGSGTCGTPTTLNDYGNITLGETYPVTIRWNENGARSELLNLMDTYYTVNGIRFNYPSGWNFGAPSNFSTVIGDFNGDKRTDFMRLSSTGYFVFLNQGINANNVPIAFSAANYSWPVSGWDFGLPSNYLSLAGDYNRDGLDDIVRINGTLKFTMFSRGDGTFSYGVNESMTGWNFGVNHKTEWATIQGDFDGNGTKDIMRMNGVNFFQMLSTPN